MAALTLLTEAQAPAEGRFGAVTGKLSPLLSTWDLWCLWDNLVPNRGGKLQGSWFILSSVGKENREKKKTEIRNIGPLSQQQQTQKP